MKIQIEQFEVEVMDEFVRSNPPADSSLHYSKEYLLGEDYQNAPRYGIIVKSQDGSINFCTVLANGSSTRVHANSVVAIDHHLFLAIGNLICCLEIPSLALKWHQHVDMATCLGVYVSPDQKGIISHGEINITKVNFEGKIEWSVSGKDIFTEGFQLNKDYIEAIDFNHEKYCIDILTGRSSIIKGG